MYKIFDVQCEECKKIEEIFIDDKEDFPTCSECEGEVKRIFTKFNFKLIYNNKTDMCAWGDNGYDSSQY
jgi:predicted nucleic acid-binding Zn ribbon protein